MSSLISSLFATIVTVPLIIYFFVFIASKQLTKKHRLSVNRALDISTFFLMISVHYLILTIWGKSFLWLILLIIILIAIIFVIIHWKVKQEIVFSQVFKGVWRFNFLVFMSAYIILLLFGLIRSITDSIS